MDYTTFGRTGLRVSVAGLGCGGHSRLGQSQGASEAESVAVVRAALDMGVTFIDTAFLYGTEKIVGLALEGRRDQAVISTKAPPTIDYPGRTLMSGAQMMARIDESLTALRTDYIDIFNVHGARVDEMDYVNAEFLPVLQHAQAQGKIRFLGITERFAYDTNHAMLSRALESGAWDSVMVGFNVLNPSARPRVLQRTRAENLGVQCMFAVRRLNDPATLGAQLAKAAAAGQLDLAALDPDDPLGFLRDYANTLTEAAYRFCRHEPGVHVVLTGTGKITHLRDNIAAISSPRLPAEALARIDAIFGRVDTISGE